MINCRGQSTLNLITKSKMSEISLISEISKIRKISEISLISEISKIRKISEISLISEISEIFKLSELIWLCVRLVG